MFHVKHCYFSRIAYCLDTAKLTQSLLKCSLLSARRMQCFFKVTVQLCGVSGGFYAAAPARQSHVTRCVSCSVRALGYPLLFGRRM